MFDTIEYATSNEFFTDQTTNQVRLSHGRNTPLHSPLLGIRLLLASIAKKYITDFIFEESRILTKETYSLDLAEYTVKISVASFHPMHAPERRVRHPETVLSLNSLLKKLHAEWKTHQSQELNDEYILVHNLVLRIFAISSPNVIFETEVDTTCWSIFFNDPRALAHAEIVVERKVAQ